MVVYKNSGEVEEFNQEKLKQSLELACKYGGEKVAESDLQDMVGIVQRRLKLATSSEAIAYEAKRVLHEQGFIDANEAYARFAEIQKYKREQNTTDGSILGLLQHTDVGVMDENSNKNPFLASTQRDLMAGVLSKDITKRMILAEHLLDAHNSGKLHFHDMDYAVQSIFNCCLINLEDMLDNGTVINDKMVRSPKSFVVACTVTTQIMAQVASGQYGGQSISIKPLAKYLARTRRKYEKKFQRFENREELVNEMVLEELASGVQTIRYQLSTLQTTNGQAPFATIYLEVEPGHEYELEMAMIVEEMLRQRMEGMENKYGQNISEAFPKLVYLLDEHNCLEGGKYDYLTKLAAKCSAKRLCPDYQSAKIMRENYGEAFPPMGCRSHLSPWKDADGNLKWYGRFNQGAISLNLPSVALQALKVSGAEGDPLEEFWSILDSRLKLCYEALLVRHNLLLKTKSDVSPIHWQHGAVARLQPGEVIDPYLMDGYSTLSLGYVGMYETVYALIGESHTTVDGEALAKKIMYYMKAKCDEWAKTTGLGFSLYGTPAESLIHRFCDIDRDNFGVVEGVTDKEYYTNSYHVDVREEINAFDKLKFESDFHHISSGGCISYIEVPDMQNNLEAVEEIINFIYHNVQYAEINTKADLCYKCRFNGEILTDDNLQWYCPQCGNTDKREMQVIRRTCGYIGSNFWNKGRTAEIKDRVLHL